jgi:predicted secreted protein
LALPIASLCYKEGAIHVGAKARQYVTAIPSKPTSGFVWDLAHNVLSLGLGISGGNVKE